MVKKEGSMEEKIDGKNLTVILRGEIDHHNAAFLRTRIDKLIYEKKPPKLILDLSAIEFMDSSGLGLIMGRYSLVRKLGGQLVIRKPTANILRICKLAGMERMISIETNKNKEKKLENETK